MSIETLISDYLLAVEKCLSLFDESFGRRDLIRAWREDVIPQIGELPGGAKYQLHGVGCFVELLDQEVDFDFASKDTVGFDAWRLSLFAEQFPERYPEYQSQEKISVALDECVAMGIAIPSSWPYLGEVNRDLLVLRPVYTVSRYSLRRLYYSCITVMGWTAP